MYLKLLLFTILLFIGTALQAAQEGTQTFSLDGRAFSNSNATTPLLDNSVQFKVQILNNAQDCILYEETQTKNTNTTNGYFVLQVGDATVVGKRSSGDSNNSMASVYSNTVASINGKLVSDGTTVCTYNPASGHTRYVRIVMTPSGDGLARVLTPLVALDSVPSAIVAERAETLRGILPNQLLQVNTTTSSLSQTNLESLMGATSFSRLTTLASADPTTYIKSNTNGSIGIPVVSGDPTGLANGQVWFESVSGTLRYYDGAVKNVGTGSASFPLLAPDGAIANPSYSFANSTGTGLSYNFGMITFNVGGTNLMGMSSTNLQFNQSGSAATPVINWGLDSSDSNTGIFHPAPDTVALSTNGVERFRVNASGDVAIGITNPTGPFHVVGGTNTTGAGAPITITGQSSTASGDNNGGDINITGGARSGNAANGRINLLSNTNVSGALGVEEGSGTAGYTGSSVTDRAPIAAFTVGQNFSSHTVAMTLRTRNATSTDQRAYMAAVPNNGVFTPSIAFGHQTGNTAYQERMRIDQYGNVGIGTTAPTVPLELTRSSPGTIASAGTTVTGTGTSFLSTFKVGDVIYANGQVRAITVISSDTSLATDSAFNPVLAGINYTRTQAKVNGTLEIQADGIGATTGVGSPYQDLLVLKNYGTSGNWQTGSAIKFEGLGAKTLARIGVNWDGPNAGDLTFTTNAPASGYMIYNVGGNFSVGSKTGPDSLFDVSSTTGPIFTLSRQDTTVVSGDVIGTIQFWNNDSDSTTQKIFGNIEMQAAQDIATDAAAGNMIFRITAATVAGAPVERMRINSNGNVGIGWDDPDVKLHVRTSGVSGLAPGTDVIGHFEGGGIQISTGSTAAGVIRFGDDGTTAANNQPGYIMYDHANDSMSFKVNSSERFRVDSLGRMGIGDVSPDTTLKVNGSLCVKSDDNNCAGAVAGTIYANNTTVQSADYAEYFLSEGYLDKGEIVGLNSKTGLARRYQVGDKLLGVVSTSPGVVGNSDIKDKVSVLVALMGQVPFKKQRVKIKENVVSTIDDQPIGYLLASGHVYVNISSNSNLKETVNKIQKLENENLEMRKRLERLERAIAQEN